MPFILVMFSESLVHAYTPVLGFIGLGWVLRRWLPERVPYWLGRWLYWVGVPIQIFTLARRTSISGGLMLTPPVTIGVLGLGAGLALVSLWGYQRQLRQANQASLLQSRQGSWVLASMLGNVSFIGLAIAPNFVSDAALGLLVLYSVTHNILGSYGLGVFIASCFGHAGLSESTAEPKSEPKSEPVSGVASPERSWWQPWKDVVLVPSLWAFGVGLLSQRWELPWVLEEGLEVALAGVVGLALLLNGIRLSQLQGWQSLRLAVIPTLIKTVLLPLITGVVLWGVGWEGDRRLAMVLMSGMPTAFSGLILAEEYNLDRELIAGSIALSSVIALLAIPVWFALFA